MNNGNERLLKLCTKSFQVNNIIINNVKIDLTRDELT